MLSIEQNLKSDSALLFLTIKAWLSEYVSTWHVFCVFKKACVLSHQYTEALTFPGQSLTNTPYFLAVCLTCCHTAASFPNQGEEVGSFD